MIPQKRHVAWAAVAVTVVVVTWVASSRIYLGPGVLSPGGQARLDLADFPVGTRLVEIDVDEETTLRGVHVPGDPGAPLVLHLVRKGESVTSIRAALRTLHDAGLASLMIDWTGVGASDGSCAREHVVRDARAMWTRAVELAGGEDRVFVRGKEIGALAALALSEEGASPGALSLLGLQRPESYTIDHYVHTGQSLHPWMHYVPGWFSPIRLDLGAALSKVRAPLFVVGACPDYAVPYTYGEDERMKALVTSFGATYRDGGFHPALLGHDVVDAIDARELDFLLAAAGR